MILKIKGPYRKKYAVYLREFLLDFADECGSVKAACDRMNLNHAYAYFALNDNKWHMQLVNALIREGAKKPPPIDPRNRAWVPTDDMERAVEVLGKLYPEYNFYSVSKKWIKTESERIRTAVFGLGRKGVK